MMVICMCLGRVLTFLVVLFGIYLAYSVFASQ